MGWARCGYNNTIGKWMGYGYDGVCSEPGCNKVIDHGLSYVCGGMHEGGEHGCGDYFCEEHLEYHWCGSGGECKLCKKCMSECKLPKCQDCESILVGGLCPECSKVE